MRRAILLMVMMVVSFSQAGVCSGQETADFLRRLGEQFLGEESAGSLNVDSNPKGASVFVDNVFKGKTPLSLDGIAPGITTVLVELVGYVPQDKDVEIQPGKTKAVVFTLVRARSEAATAVTFSANPEGPSEKGTVVTFKAKGQGGTGRYEYRFLMKGPATGGEWVQTQDYSSKETWTWKTAAEDVGSNQILVHVRSAGSKERKEAHKVMSYKVNAVAPASGVTFSVDPRSPSEEGTVVTFKAKGQGGTGWYEYRFLMKGPATNRKWVQTQDYSSKETWTWKTTAEDAGSNQILVHVRSAGSKEAKEAHRVMNYQIVAVKRPGPDQTALGKLLRELEEKINEADRRNRAHPDFLDELRDLVRQYR